MKIKVEYREVLPRYSLLLHNATPKTIEFGIEIFVLNNYKAFLSYDGNCFCEIIGHWRQGKLFSMDFFVNQDVSDVTLMLMAKQAKTLIEGRKNYQNELL